MSMLTDKERLELLWKEYEYRHQHVWRVIFQVTATATFLAAIPYLNIPLAQSMGRWILVPPVLAFALIAYGIASLEIEMFLLSLIRTKYREVQHSALSLDHRSNRRFLDFTWRARYYMYFLLLLSVIHVGVTAASWLPNVAKVSDEKAGDRSGKSTLRRQGLSAAFKSLHLMMRSTAMALDFIEWFGRSLADDTTLFDQGQAQGIVRRTGANRAHQPTHSSR
jgi:hypothetical protein